MQNQFQFQNVFSSRYLDDRSNLSSLPKCTETHPEENLLEILSKSSNNTYISLLYTPC